MIHGGVSFVTGKNWVYSRVRGESFAFVYSIRRSDWDKTGGAELDCGRRKGYAGQK